MTPTMTDSAGARRHNNTSWIILLAIIALAVSCGLFGCATNTDATQDSANEQGNQQRQTGTGVVNIYVANAPARAGAPTMKTDEDGNMIASDAAADGSAASEKGNSTGEAKATYAMSGTSITVITGTSEASQVPTLTGKTEQKAASSQPVDANVSASGSLAMGGSSSKADAAASKEKDAVVNSSGDQRGESVALTARDAGELKALLELLRMGQAPADAGTNSTADAATNGTP